MPAQGMDVGQRLFIDKGGGLGDAGLGVSIDGRRPYIRIGSPILRFFKIIVIDPKAGVEPEILRNIGIDGDISYIVQAERVNIDLIREIGDIVEIHPFQRNARWGEYGQVGRDVQR